MVIKNGVLCSAVVNAEEGVGVSAALDLYNSLKGDPCSLPTIMP